MAMPEDFKRHCRNLAAKQPQEIADAIYAALEAEDHDAVDKALDAALAASDRRIEALRDVRLAQNKLMGVV